MDVIIAWQHEVIAHLKKLNIDLEIIQVDGFFILNCENKLMVNLVALNNVHLPQHLLNLQAAYQNQAIILVHLWEDVWRAKPSQVLNRFSSFLGLNKKIHARKTSIIAVNQAESIAFFNTHHLQGYVTAKYTFGLVANAELVALASFSEARTMTNKGADYQSAELVRFVSKSGTTIVGGLSKLIKYFVKQISLTDVMTYADRDWSLGKGYQQIDFTFSEVTPPAFLYCQQQSLVRYFPHRLPKAILAAYKAQNVLNLDNFLALHHFDKVFNTGNLKYHLYLK